ncbi:hypothetical protein H2203_004052 [Taxawa tesnikishii (nom. ined.)]|nr:hypothetical protein H2203_004052 [Dothideales sp. JES 119]
MPKKYKEAEERKAKEEGRQKKTKGERQQERENADARAQRIAQGDGISAGDTHQTPHNVHDVLDEIEEEEHLHRETPEQRRLRNPISLVGQGLDVVGHGFGALGHIGKDFVGGVTQNVDRAIRDVNETFDAANTGRGFVGGDSAYNSTIPHGVSGQGPATISFAQDVKDANPGAQASAESLVQDGPGANTTAENAADEHWRKVEAREREQELQQTPGLTVTDYTPTVSPKVSTHDGTFDEKRSEKNPNKASAESGPKTRQPNRARPNQLKPPAKPWMVWKRNAAPAIPFPSPQPHTAEEEEYPLGNLGPSGDVDADSTNLLEKDEEEPIVYPKAYNEEFTTGDQDDDFAVWKKYMETKDRETLREPLVNKTWFPRLPLLGKKIDKIYHLRKELARLNVEIEKDQNESDRFPLMNSAFIQFNHQVAAHMACQSLSHHVPQHMAPRLVEISPTDVIWSNMSIKWWERYIRVAVVLVISAGLVILFGIPVTFTGALSQINSLADEWHWLKWLADLPGAIVSIIQGILPPVLLSLLLTLVPIIFRQLVKQEGVPTGNAQELGIQGYYFFFLFVQVFLVVTLSSGITQFIGSATNLESIPTALAQNLPKASNYFFSYLIIQALSSSAGALLQAVSLLVWFLWAPIVDSTPREKWRRQVSLQNVQWGSFFPPFTNFAVIGLIYSIIAPFILVFNLIIFSLYWIVQRYNILYVYQFRHDTGGLLFPKAINQLFTGLYVLEVCLIGLFFLAQNPKGDQSAYPEAIIMIVVTVFTAIYQFLLNDAFKPLFRYLPITLEDDAVIRDEEFARARKWKTNPAGEQNEEDVQDVLEARERQEEEEEQRAEEEEHKRISQYRRSSRNPSPSVAQSHHDTLRTKPTSTPTSSWKTDRWRTVMDVRDPVTRLGRHLSKRVPGGRGRSTTLSEKPTAGTETDLHTAAVDVEHQRAIGDVLFPATMTNWKT